MTHDYNLWFRLVDRLTSLESIVDCVLEMVQSCREEICGMMIRVQITEPAVEDYYILYFNFIL